MFGDAARLEVFAFQPGIHGVASHGYELECSSNGSDRTLGYFELELRLQNAYICFVLEQGARGIQTS